MASFPLVPYANRIAGGRFAFDGRDYRLPLNFGDHPHSIHGFGWQATWTPKETGPATARLIHDHDGSDGWPSAYRAEQIVSLTASHLSMSLSVKNVGDALMPVGLGFHPYFLADADTTLRFVARGLWLSSPDMLPERAAPADALGDWSRPAIVCGSDLIDNVYGGWDGSAVIQRGDGIRLTLSAPGVTWLHVYRPPDSNDFCLEPVSHMPDAINRNGMDVLAPGDVARLSMTVAIDKIDQALPKTAAIA